MRPPVIAGIAPGAGATTVAAALHGVDGGCWRGGPVDVLVVGPGHALPELPAGIPVLVVRSAGPAAAAPAARRGTVVVLPDVPAWRGPDEPRAAAGLLRLAEGERPAALRGAVDALLAVTAALLGSGVLDRPRAVVVPPVPRAAPAVVSAVRVTPVVVRRAAPVVPRLVAGRPLRLSTPSGAGERVPGTPVDTTPAEPSRRSLHLVLPTPGLAHRPRPSAVTDEPDDDAVEAALDGEHRARRTG